MLLRELKYSLRNLRKSPGFALTAILTLALGIGATTAVFTVVDSVILKPLSYRNSGQLSVVWEKVKFLATSTNPYVGPNPRHTAFWKEHNSVFSDLCVLIVGTRGITLGIDHPHLVGSILAQPNFLDLLQVTPFMGRDFTPTDGINGHDQVAIITYSMWQGLFHGAPNVVGKSLRIQDTRYEVIGVLPKNFQFPNRTVLSSAPSQQTVTTAPPIELVTPLALDPKDYSWNGDYGNWVTLGRLKPGITMGEAQSQLNVLEARIAKEFGISGGRSDALLTYVQPMQDAMVNSSRTALWMLLAAVIALMLIACVNLANAQLVRAVSREREAAVRSALGASARQLLSSSLAESVVLAIIGGTAGVLLAFDAIALFKRYAPIDLPRMAEIQPNYTVLMFAVLIVLGSALSFGIMPALHFVRTDPQQALQQNSARSQGRLHGRRFRLALIGIQVFGCTALLLITGLFVKSLANLLQTDHGFTTGNIVIAEVNPPHGFFGYNLPQRIKFDDAILARLRSLPGVTAAAVVNAMPLEGERWIEGIVRADKPNEHPPLCNARWVSSDFFKVLQERLIAGRFLEERDRDANNVVISQSSARAAWPDEDPLGKQIKFHDQIFTVVGIIADARINSLKDTPVNMLYLPYRNKAPFPAIFLVRSSQSSEALVPDVRRAIWAENPEIIIARVKTFTSQVNDSLSTERFQTFVLIAFGLAALFLAILGIYGILSYSVAGRRQEIGVRMALGATRQRIYSLTMSEAAMPVAFGLLCGWAASVAGGKLVQKLLYGVTGVNWVVTAIVVILSITCAAAAAFLPAHRAAAVDPMQALRVE